MLLDLLFLVYRHKQDDHNDLKSKEYSDVTDI